MDLYGVGSGYTDAAGSLTLTDLHPEPTYRLECRPRSAPVPLWVREGIRADDVPYHFLVTPEEVRTATVSGVVVSAQTGEPAVRVELLVDERASTPVADERARSPAGGFSFPSIQLGRRYRVVAEVPGQAPAGVLLDPLEGDREVRLELTDFGMIELTMRDEADRPIPFAAARLVRRPQLRNALVFLSADERGVAGCDRVVPGEHAVFGLDPDQALATVEVVAGQITRVTVRSSGWTR